MLKCSKHIKPINKSHSVLPFQKYKRTEWSCEVYVTSRHKGRDRKEHEVEKQNNVKAVPVGIE